MTGGNSTPPPTTTIIKSFYYWQAKLIDIFNYLLLKEATLFQKKEKKIQKKRKCLHLFAFSFTTNTMKMKFFNFMNKKKLTKAFTSYDILFCI